MATLPQPTVNLVAKVRVTSSEMNLIKLMAKAAERGGVSRIRSNQGRNLHLAEDQIIGQIGAFAGHKYWFGTTSGYLQSRHVANMYPDLGDGGSDIIGANVDFKASRIRSNRPLREYNLAVRERERGPGKVYILVLVETDLETATAHLMGWATDEMLPESPDQAGPLKGAYTIKAFDLQPMPPLQWQWVEGALAAQRIGS